MQNYIDGYKNMLDPERIPNIMTKKWNPLVPVQKNKFWTPVKVRDFVLESQLINKMIDDVRKVNSY